MGRAFFQALNAALIALAIAVVVLALPVGTYMYSHNTQFDRTITVKAHEDSASGDSHLKLIQTTTNDWYVVGDSFWWGQFNSRDTWGSMQDGHTYRVHGYGWRMGFWSSYPNVLSAEEKR